MQWFFEKRYVFQNKLLVTVMKLKAIKMRTRKCDHEYECGNLRRLKYEKNCFSSLGINEGNDDQSCRTSM